MRGLKEKRALLKVEAEKREPIIERVISDLYNLLLGPKISIEEKILFLLQLQMAFKSGLPLTAALRSLYSSWKGNLKDYIKLIYQGVYKGKSLSDAMRSLPYPVFPDIVISMIRAGESTGQLERTLTLAYKFLENRRKLTWTIISSTAYPLVITLVGIGTIAFFSSYFLPTLLDLYLSLDVKLPAVTLLLMKMQNLLSFKTFLIIIAVIFLIWLIFYISRYYTPLNRLLYRALFKVPVLGDLYRKFFLSLFTRMLMISIAAGVPISDTIKLIRTMFPPALGEVFQQISQDLFSGSPLYKAISKHKWFFPRTVVDVVRVYEESAREDVLEKIADMMEFEYYLTITNFIKILEPLIMGLMGSFVLFIAAGVFSPMIKLLRQ